MPMPQQGGSYIDLKNCTIYIEDGYTQAGTAGVTGPYTAGASLLPVTTIVGILEVGLPLAIAGQTTPYFVTGVGTTGGNTTNVTVSPVLSANVANSTALTFGPHQLEIKVGDGTLTYNETKNREYKLNRGRIDKVRNGDEAPLEVSMTLAWLYVTAASGDDFPSVEDFLKKRGLAANYTSTGEGCDPFAVDLIIKNDPGACNGVDDPVEVITFPEFRYEKLNHDAKAGTISCDGKCNTTEAQAVRSAHV